MLDAKFERGMWRRIMNKMLGTSGELLPAVGDCKKKILQGLGWKCSWTRRAGIVGQKSHPFFNLMQKGRKWTFSKHPSCSSLLRGKLNLYRYLTDTRVSLAKAWKDHLHDCNWKDLLAFYNYCIAAGREFIINSSNEIIRYKKKHLTEKITHDSQCHKRLVYLSHCSKTVRF